MDLLSLILLVFSIFPKLAEFIAASLELHLLLILFSFYYFLVINESVPINLYGCQLDTKFKKNLVQVIALNKNEEKDNNISSQKSILHMEPARYLAAAVSVLYLLIVSRMQTCEVADHSSLATSIGNLWIIIGAISSS